MRILVLGFGVAFALAAPALAAPDDLTNEVASEVMSPYCDGVTLHDCQSQPALDLRGQIEAWARDGWTKSQIIAELEEQFGPRIHATPTRSEGLAAWLLPAAALLTGLAGAVVLTVRWTRRRTTDVPEAIAVEDRARVERELAAFRGETP